MPKHTVIATSFRPFRRGTLLGFCNIYIPEMCMSVHDIAVHESSTNGFRWVQLPAKPLLNDDGSAQRNSDGRIQYVTILNFDDRTVREAFSAAAVDALIKLEPDAFDATVS